MTSCNEEVERKVTSCRGRFLPLKLHVSCHKAKYHVSTDIPNTWGVQSVGLRVYKASKIERQGAVPCLLQWSAVWYMVWPLIQMLHSSFSGERQAKSTRFWCCQNYPIILINILKLSNSLTIAPTNESLTQVTYCYFTTSTPNVA